MPKLKLNIDEPISFKVIGIVSSLKDYRLAWLAQNRIEIELIKVSDVVIHNKKKAKSAIFSRFTAEDEINRLSYRLISTKFKGEALEPKLKSFDYVLLIKGELAEDAYTALSEKISNFPNVQLVLPVDSAILKDSSVLIFEE